MTFQIKPLSNNIGAEVIGLNLRNALDEDMVDRVNTEWLAHNILLFRGQKLTRPQQIKFARWFGDLTLTDATTTHPKYPEVQILSNVRVAGKNLGVRPEETGEGWHSDHIFMKIPPKGTLFYAVEAPTKGGDTYFANQTAAYEALSEEMKESLEGLVCTYSFYDSWKYLSPDRPPLPPKIKQKLPPATHPLVRTHPETGRRALYAGMRGVSPADKVHGMSIEQGCALLKKLRSFATRPRFVYRHHWLPGDVILWDNRCTMHRASVFDEKLGRRHCYRVTIEGEDVPH